ncbi:transposase [Streptomyces sp. NBRC 110611]|nr:transposase [Streptomyces sp. NBRC 110611]
MRILLREEEKVSCEKAQELVKFRLAGGDVLCVSTGEPRPPVLVGAEQEGWLLGANLIQLQTAGLDQRRRLAASARGAAARAAGRGAARPVRGGDRRLPRQGAGGRPKTGRSPVDRGRPGSRQHVVCDATDTPSAVTLTGGNRNEIHEAFLGLACSLICWHRLQPTLR